MDDLSEDGRTSWESVERGIPLRLRLADARIDPVDYSEAVGMGIGTVLYADVSDGAWNELLAEYREAIARRDR